MVIKIAAQADLQNIMKERMEEPVHCFAVTKFNI
jgi:hypothetical protein